MKTSSIQRALPAGLAIVASIGTLMAGGAQAFAATASTPSATAPKVTLQQAEQLARKTFSIADSYTVQSESYSAGNGQPPQYNLTFQDPDPAAAGQSINVSIDANTGWVVNFNQPSDDNQFVFPVPVSADQARQLADTWAKKLFPSQFGQVKALPLAPVQGALQGPTQYTYTYERVVDGLPAPFDGFSLTIDQDGQLVSVQDHWTDLPFPSAKPTLSKSAANQVYGQSLELHLAYQSIYSANRQPATDLVYEAAPQNAVGWWGQLFTPQSNIQFPVIDATSGKVLDGTGQAIPLTPYAPPKPLVTGGPSASFTGPSVHWTQEQVEQYATKALGITSADTLTNVYEYSNPQSHTTWNLTWQTPGGLAVTATVDADAGILTGFSAYPTHPAPPTKAATKLTQAQVTAAVDAFVKRLYPQHTGALAVLPEPSNPGDGSQLQTSYQIIPLVNGLPDETGSGSVSVNPQTGEVQNLYLNIQASSGVYPAPAQAMPVSKATATWMAARPLTLEYLETQPQLQVKMNPAGKSATAAANALPRIVLVYAPTADQTSSGPFNAVTGTFETYGSQLPFTGTIQDIAGLPAAPQIQLLVDRELISVDSRGDVHPNQTMTHSAFIKLLVDALGYQGRIDPLVMKSAAAQSALGAIPVTSPDYDEVAAAYSMGWIPAGEPFDPNATTTRDYAAQVLSRAVGMTALLSHPDAFQFSPSDVAQIPAGDKAGDALAVTLGLLSLDASQDFQPTASLTLADAAVAVVQAADILGMQGHPDRVVH
ncbi:MAG: hypothetical protein K6T78_10655 [Alicyclobacillus sp.]|nr:hypothetical protein [Alicyclobacillus sp.]